MKIKDLPLYILAATVVIGFFTLLYILIYVPIPETNRDILNIVVGALIGAFTGIMGYFFGSSRGSKEKTEMLTRN